MLLFLSIFFIFPLQAQSALLKNYADVVERLQKLPIQNPGIVELFELGMADSGEIIRGVKVGVGKIKNLVVGTHHGNEYASAEVALAFAEALSKNPISAQTVFIIPVLNIEGFNKRSRNEVAAGQSYDPNRDYPGPCGTEGPFRLKSTRSLAQFIEKENIVASATLHTFFPAVVYPWGLSSHDLHTPYQEIFENLTKAATIESKYQIGNSSEVIYPADGTFEDYAYWKHGIWSLLFELGFSHSPSESEVKSTIELNIPGLTRMLASAPSTRAPDHEFRGTCDARLRSLDRHDE